MILEMFSPTQTIVIVCLAASGSLLLLLGLLFYKLRKLRQKNAEYAYLRDHVLLFPGDKKANRSGRGIPNRMVQILQVHRRLSDGSENGHSYPPPRNVTAAGLFSQGELLRVPAFPIGYPSTSGSETEMAKNSTESGNEDAASGHETASKDDESTSSVELQDVERPAIEFNVNYFSATSSLNVTIVRITNIPSQFRKHCSSYVKVSLKAFNKLKTRRHKTKTIRNSLNPFYDEEVSFQGYEFDELKNYRLRFSAYAKSRTLSKKMLVGDLFVPLTRPDFEPDSLLGCSERLSLACPETGKRGPYVLAGETGYLQLELAYHYESRRLKVVVRKGQGLPARSDVGAPEYYVIVSLLRASEAMSYKETRPSLGTNPTWNQPFLFYLEQGSEDEHWIQCLVMKGKIFSSDGAIGQVLVGSQVGLAGRQHWSQAVDSDVAEDVVKWHEILPVKTTCSGTKH